MKRIIIERHKNPDEMQSAGLIEGETDDGQRWILFLDAQGRPEVFWPRRDEDGAVQGEGIGLKDSYSTIYRQLKAGEDGEGDELLGVFPIFDDGMRGIVFCVSPPDHERDNTAVRVVRFLDRLLNGMKRGEAPGEDGWADQITDADREAAKYSQPARD